ncbi:hypothetical protein jhhlp_004572, partial [Lomentospora prolificans]
PYSNDRLIDISNSDLLIRPAPCSISRPGRVPSVRPYRKPPDSEDCHHTTQAPKMLSLQGSFPNNYDHHPTSTYDQHSRPSRKRKADPQDNERLSKRLGRLNIGQNLRRLYATVEDDTSANQAPSSSAANADYGNNNQSSRMPEDYMQMDDSKHKVYIYNLDDELSSSESEAEEGKLIFLPDIEMALKANRIPPVIRANPHGQLAGHNLDDMQLVLYNVPSSLTVAPEHDNVRKAIIEARQRARERQRRNSEEVDSIPSTPASTQGMSDDDDAMDLS